MKRSFDDDELYHQRKKKTETAFSVIKRRFGSVIIQYNDHMKTKAIMCQVLVYNCHRMCIIFLVFLMISRLPSYHYYSGGGVGRWYTAAPIEYCDLFMNPKKHVCLVCGYNYFFYYHQILQNDQF